MKGINKALETFWLVVTIACMAIAAYYLAEKGWEEGAFYLLFPALAGIMYGFRRSMRKRMGD